MLLKDLFKERPSPLEILEAERQGRPTPRGRWPQRKKISTRGDFYDSLLSQIGPGLGGSIVTIADVAYQMLDRGYPSQRLVVLADDADGSIAAVRQYLPTTHIYSFRNSRDGTGFADFLSPPIAAVMLPGTLFPAIGSDLTLDQFMSKVSKVLEPGGTITLFHHNPFVVPRGLGGSYFLDAFEWSERISREGQLSKVSYTIYTLTFHPKKLAPLKGKPLGFQEHSDTAGRIKEKAPGSKNEATISRYVVPDGLPSEPPALWPGRKTGRPRLGEEDVLVEFIRANYGPYFEKFRDKLRAYIYRHDPKLYQAIASYEHRRPLPEDLLMPSEQVRTEERLKRALQGDYGDLTSDEKASVRKKLWRLDKLGPH